MTFVRCDIENVKDIFCGHYTSFAIKQDGTLWSCGQSDYGQIGRGDGFSTYSSNFEQVLDNVKTGSAGILHTMVIRKDGTVWSCGYNGNGQQGDGIATSMNSFKQITTNTNDAVAIICGARHSILIKSDSSIWVTGQNTSGQLGTGNNTDIGTFTGLSISIGTGNN
jgi:alpha-tubulin suppressor-like RCC1 family protein